MCFDRYDLPIPIRTTDGNVDIGHPRINHLIRILPQGIIACSLENTLHLAGYSSKKVSDTYAMLQSAQIVYGLTSTCGKSRI
jgi:hypothetical protein